MNQELFDKTFAGYRKPNVTTIPKFEEIQNKVKELGELIMKLCPQSREKSLALSDLQSCRMFANASIAIHDEENEEKFDDKPDTNEIEVKVGQVWYGGSPTTSRYQVINILKSENMSGREVTSVVYAGVYNHGSYVQQGTACFTMPIEDFKSKFKLEFEPESEFKVETEGVHAPPILNIVIGNTYRLIKNGDLYKVLDFTGIKDAEGKWVKGVIYTEYGKTDSFKYVRSIEDFSEKFALAKIKKIDGAEYIYKKVKLE